MDKKEIKKLVFQAYNLGIGDLIPRPTHVFNEWFEETYSPRDKDESELARILRVVCEVNRVDIEAVKGKRRFRELMTARREYCYMAWKLTEKIPYRNTLSEIGAEIGKDYTTVLHHKNTIINWLDIKCYNLKENLEMIEAKL